jgi:hypothetical protein
VAKREAGKDRRRSKRYRRRFKVRIWWEDLESIAFTGDVSATGAMLETNLPLELGTRLHLEVDLNGQPHFAECVVTRKRTYPRQARGMFKPGVGVRFVSLMEAVRGLSEEQEAPAAEAQPVSIPMEVDLREPEKLQEAYDQDLKHGGLRVLTTEIPEFDSVVTVPVWLPEPHGRIDCEGTVVKTFEDPPGFALRLSDVDQVRLRVLEILRG